MFFRSLDVWRAFSHSNPREKKSSTDGSNSRIESEFSPKLDTTRRRFDQAIQRIAASVPVFIEPENRENPSGQLKTAPNGAVGGLLIVFVSVI
jgi:hypothetical protein